MTAIRLKRNGFFQNCRKVAEPIRFIARGSVRSTGDSKCLFHFRDCDGRDQTLWVDADQVLVHNLRRLADSFARRGFRWPPSHAPLDMLPLVIEREPKRRITLVDGPGWYNDVYVTNEGQFGAGSDSFRINPDSEAKVAEYGLGRGDLADWQALLKMVKRSSRLCLTLGATFGAPLLRPLGVGSFGINIYGPSSNGKTTALHLAASAMGLKELATWADTQAALEEMALGRRDGVLLVDEVADGNRTKKELASLITALSFGFARNRAKRRATRYENSGAPSLEDFRIIVLTTSERPLSAISPRLPGEAVRLADLSLPKGQKASGIFDGCPPNEADAVHWAKGAVEYIYAHGNLYRGHAFRHYIEKVASDPSAITLAAKWVRKFEIPITSAQAYICDW